MKFTINMKNQQLLVLTIEMILIENSDAMRDHLNQKYNIPFNKIISEPSSKDTVGDAVLVRKYNTKNK